MISMTKALEEVLQGLKKVEGVHSTTLVSRSGVHIAGDVPSGVHSETFVAMSAIIIGAAETASIELKTSLNYLKLEMKDSILVLISAGNKALLVTKISNNVNFEKVLSGINDTVNKIKETL